MACSKWELITNPKSIVSNENIWQIIAVCFPNFLKTSTTFVEIRHHVISSFTWTKRNFHCSQLSKVKKWMSVFHLLLRWRRNQLRRKMKAKVLFCEAGDLFQYHPAVFHVGLNLRRRIPQSVRPGVLQGSRCAGVRPGAQSVHGSDEKAQRLWEVSVAQSPSTGAAPLAEPIQRDCPIGVYLHVNRTTCTKRIQKS